MNDTDDDSLIRSEFIHMAKRQKKVFLHDIHWIRQAVYTFDLFDIQ